MIEENPNGELKRVFGVGGVTAQVINFTIGVGIYALPALIGMKLGNGTFAGYLLCGFMFSTIMLCYAEVGTKIHASGGSYAYVEAAFGPLAGFVVNWLMIFGWCLLSDAAVMNLVLDSSSVLFPSLQQPLIRTVILFILVSLMIAVNIMGSKQSIRFIEFVSIVKVIPLIAIVIFGFRMVRPVNLHWPQLPRLEQLDSAALILFFAFAGFESSLNASGEIKNPKRAVPLGIFLGGNCIFLIYLLIQFVTQGVIGSELAEYKDAPLAEIANRAIGPVTSVLIIVATAISGLGGVNGDVLGASRVVYAGAKNHLFPSLLARVSPRFSTPFLSIATFGSLIFIVAVAGAFQQLAVLASGALLLIYLAVVLSFVKFRMTKRFANENGFKVPAGYVVAFLAIFSILYVLSNLSKNELLSTGCFVAFICAMYIIIRKRRSTETQN